MDDQDQLVKQLPLEHRLTDPRQRYSFERDVIQRHPTSDLELVFKDDAGVIHQSNKFKDSIAIRWNLDIHVRTYTSATLTVKRALFKMRVVPVQPHAKRRVKRAQTQHFTSPNPGVSWPKVGCEDSQSGGRKGCSIVKTWTESESEDQDRRECIQSHATLNFYYTSPSSKCSFTFHSGGLASSLSVPFSPDTPSLVNSPTSVSIFLRRRMTNIAPMLYFRRGR
ncbi:hypothetical protein EDB86DRAFT_1031829 [Lactarius hatsudake]|nr:hypothetical protein EDB86DRAFT_1031829 [Lactarius hatsudake]